MWIIGTRTVYGNYGRKMQVNEEGDEIEVKVEAPKRGRGRPKKLVNTQTMSWSPDLDKLMFTWVKGNLQ